LEPASHPGKTVYLAGSAQTYRTFQDFAVHSLAWAYHLASLGMAVAVCTHIDLKGQSERNQDHTSLVVMCSVEALYMAVDCQPWLRIEGRKQGRRIEVQLPGTFAVVAEGSTQGTEIWV